MAGFVEAGAGAEARAISAALEVLPPDVTSALPAEFLAAVERASGEARFERNGAGSVRAFVEQLGPIPL